MSPPVLNHILSTSCVLNTFFHLNPHNNSVCFVKLQCIDEEIGVLNMLGNML